MSERPIVVHKFGGTSVGGAARIAQCAALMAERSRAEQPVVVVSAMSGITNALLALATTAAGGDEAAALAGVDDVVRAHRDALAGLELGDADDAARTGEALDALLDDLRSVARAIAGLRELSPRVRDWVAVFGEKLCARLMAAALRARGVPASAHDADDFLDTDGVFGSASPLGEATDGAVARRLRPSLASGEIPVVTGFCGRAADGSTTTLGRGGSDFSATILGGALAAERVVIWTDVDGVFTSDPRHVAGARLVEQLHYREAAELAYYGAKVLHPRTLQPVASRNIPVEVRNSFRPDAEPTIVDGRLTPGSHPVKAVTAIRDHALVSLEGRGMAGVPGMAARLFGALAARDISVTVISQSSAESSICVAVPAAEAGDAEVALKAEFRLDLAHGNIEEIAVRPRVGLVAAVGIGMAHHPGVSGRVFAALGAAGVNVLAIAQGSSELNITFAVDEEQVAHGLRALHTEFGLHRRDPGVVVDDAFEVVVHGLGNIGRRVATMLLERSDSIEARFGVRPRIVALSDSSGAVLAPGGIAPQTVLEAVEAKSRGARLASQPGGVALRGPSALVGEVFGWRMRLPIFVDTTADAGSGVLFEEVLRAGADVVTANKWPMAAPQADWQRLQACAAETGRLVRAEATVGAGLPVIDTFEMLLATGDRVERVEGCLSGTLGFVLDEVNAGRAFSEAVREAKARGYTEPDPVIDLLGADVLRKAIILRRVAGLDHGDLPAAAEPLVDPALLGADEGTLWPALEARDAHFARLASEARARGEMLHYVARVEADRIEVGLGSYAVESPLGRLGPGDNIVVVRSERYRDRPLAITGPGAGIDVTAMGVVADILRVVAERGTRVR